MTTWTPEMSDFKDWAITEVRMENRWVTLVLPNGIRIKFRNWKSNL